MAHSSWDGVDCAVTIRMDAGSSDAIDCRIVNYCTVFVSNSVVDMVRNSNSVFDKHRRLTHNHSLTYSLCMDT